ncbi:MAG: class I SAM-dependent methyltransferase [Candidatus Sumerlaeia bacterium]
MDFDPYAKDYQDELDGILKASGESTEYFAEYKSRWLIHRLRKNPPQKILDYGCGIGLASLYLARYFPEARVTAFDPSAESLEQARKRLGKSVELVHRPADLDSDYDLVLLANVIHHVQPNDRPALMDQMTRLVRPGGRLLIWEHHPWNPMTRRVVAKVPFDKDAVLIGMGEGKRLLRQYGFTIERGDYVIFFPRFAAWLRWMEPYLAWLPMGAQYALMARRQ